MSETQDPILRAMLFGGIGAALVGAITSFALNSAFNANAESLFALPIWVLLTVAPTVSIAVTLGLAWHSFALKHNWTSAAAYAVAGATAGFVIPALVYLVIWSSHLAAATPSSLLLPLLICAYGACLGALTCWLAWLIRRPDRDAPNPPMPHA